MVRLIVDCAIGKRPSARCKSSTRRGVMAGVQRCVPFARWRQVRPRLRGELHRS